MARRPREYTIKVTHRYVHDPEAVERGLEAWAMFLARHLHEMVAQQQNAEQAEASQQQPEEPQTAASPVEEAPTESPPAKAPRQIRPRTSKPRAIRTQAPPPATGRRRTPKTG